MINWQKEEASELKEKKLKLLRRLRKAKKLETQHKIKMEIDWIEEHIK